MSVFVDSATQNQIQSKERGVAWLFELYTDSGTLRYTTASVNVLSEGQNFIALGTLASIANLSESEDASASKVSINLTATNVSMLSLVIGDVDDYRGRPVKLYLQLFDAGFQPVGTKVPRWSGYMDKVKVTRKKSESSGGDSGGIVEIVCSRAGISRVRNYQGLRLVDSQHQKLFPGDTGLRYIRSLIETPTVWLSRKFQKL